jgi:hypothetical protein
LQRITPCRQGRSLGRSRRLRRSSILDCCARHEAALAGNPARQEFTMSTPESVVIEDGTTPSDVIPSVSIANLINVRAGVIERYGQVLKLLHEADSMGAAAHLGNVRIEIRTASRYACPILAPEALDLITREVDKGAWSYLLTQSGLRTFMDATARQKWDEEVHKGQVPELTPANVDATFSTLHGCRGDMFERGVIACFRRLSWDYKTNQPFKFGKRIILGYLFTIYGHGMSRSMHLRHHASDELDDLLRVFHLLDGRPEPDHRQGMWHQISAAVDARRDEWDGAYFHVRWFLKGSAHVTFKRLDLVDELNAILAKHYPNALPAPRP